MEKKLLEAYSSIISSEIKINIILVLNEKKLIPKKIAQNIKKRINHVSTYLSNLKENHIVICLNEDKRKGRLYQLTQLGIRVLNELKRNGYHLKHNI